MRPASLRKGFALPIVTTLMIVVAITLAGVFTVASFSVRMMRRRTARTVCRCLAQSAIEHAKGRIKARFEQHVVPDPAKAKAEDYLWFSKIVTPRNQVIGGTLSTDRNAVRLDDDLPAVPDGCTVEVAIGESLDLQIDPVANTARVIVPIVATACYDYQCGTMTETVQERVVFELGREPYTQEWLIVPEEVNPARYEDGGEP